MAQRRPPRASTYKHRFRTLRVASLILAGLLVWVVINIRNLNEFFTAYQERNRERDRVETLRRTVADLKSQERSLKLREFEKEKSVRETFRLVRPGEQMILLTPEDETTSPIGGRQTTKSP